MRAHAPFLTSWVQETAFLWVGGADATTGLHSDDEDNVLLVTHGSKHVLLHPPSSRRHLDPNPRYDNGTECCEIDAFLSEAEKARQHPPYAGCAPPLSFVLRAGDALFIPRDWFHAVRSADDVSGLGERLLQHARGPGDARRAPGPDGLRAQPARALARELRRHRRRTRSSAVAACAPSSATKRARPAMRPPVARSASQRADSKQAEQRRLDSKPRDAPQSR